MMGILAREAETKKSRRPRIEFPFLVFAAALCLAITAVLDPTYASAGALTFRQAAQSPLAAASTADWIGTIAECVTALSVIGVILQIRDQRSMAKRERTRLFQERYQSDEFATSARLTVGCTDVRDAGDCVTFIEAWSNRTDAGERNLPRPEGPTKASVHDIEKTLSLFEEMGTAYKFRQIDKKTLYMSFSIPTIQVFSLCWWLICWLRDGRLADQTVDGVTEETYAEFQKMCVSLMKKHSSLARDKTLQPNPAVRALCLPRGAGTKLRDDAAWSASRRMSLTLSRFIDAAEGHGVTGRLSALASDLNALPRAAEPSGLIHPKGWKVVLIPRYIDRVCDFEWERQWEAVGELARALDDFSDYPSLDVAVTYMERFVQTA